MIEKFLFNLVLFTFYYPKMSFLLSVYLVSIFPAHCDILLKYIDPNFFMFMKTIETDFSESISPDEHIDNYRTLKNATNKIVEQEMSLSKKIACNTLHYIKKPVIITGILTGVCVACSWFFGIPTMPGSN